MFGIDKLSYVDKVVKSTVNVRVYPDTSHPRIDQLEIGTSVKVIDTYGVWNCILIGNGVGWVHGNYLRSPHGYFSVEYWPTEYVRTTQVYGANKNYYSKWGLDGHEGWDFATGESGTKVFAVADGVVDFVRDGKAAKHEITKVYYADNISKHLLRSLRDETGIPMYEYDGTVNCDHAILIGLFGYVAEPTCEHKTWLSIHQPKEVLKEKIIAANTNHNYGVAVYIKHVEGYQTSYCHLEERLVDVADEVVAGQVIGLSDNTGNSGGNHLHMTFYKWNGNRRRIIDPTSYIDKWLNDNGLRDLRPPK